MKKIIKFEARSPQTKADENDVVDKDLVHACEQIKGFIHETYALYTGTLEYQYNEGQISAGERAVMIRKYRQKRDECLRRDIESVESFVSFYQECRAALQEALTYAKLKTTV